ncbi:MAG: DUF169 domain-containing protein [Chloroflexi bacterium]|nr:DUF169 domain-containing protein [Chloroflexota bacterium]
MGYRELTELLLEKLQILYPPAALSFVPERPAEVPATGKDVPSFCALWRWGETALFYASPEQHVMGCAIGGMVAGFPLPREKAQEVLDLMAEYCEGEEAAVPDEVAQTARVTKPAAGVVYGPLWQFPLPPDVVVMWANIIQVAVLQEVTGPVMWRNNPQGAVFTRPACSVLPIAMTHGKPAMSLGCAGMRAYTQVPDDLCLVALPGDRLGQLEEDLRKLADPQARMQFYLDKLQASMAQQQEGGA